MELQSSLGQSYRALAGECKKYRITTVPFSVPLQPPPSCGLVPSLAHSRPWLWPLLLSPCIILCPLSIPSSLGSLCTQVFIKEKLPLKTPLSSPVAAPFLCSTSAQKRSTQVSSAKGHHHTSKRDDRMTGFLRYFMTIGSIWTQGPRGKA